MAKIWNDKFGTSFKPEYIGEDFTAGSFRSGSRNLANELWSWEPQKDLQQGLKELVDWYVKNCPISQASVV